MKSQNLTELFVEVTNECLQGCIHCSSCASTQNYDYIQLNNLYDLIDQSIDLGLRSFTISGGEPMLYPDLLSLIKYIKERNLVFSLYTCGVVRDSLGAFVPVSDELVQSIADWKPEKVVFSLHGTKEVHEKISAISGSYDLTVLSIKKVLRLGIPVELHFVPMTVNVTEIEGVVRIARDLGIKKLSLLRLVMQGRCLNDLMLPNSYGLKIKQTVDYLERKYPEMSIRLGGPFNCVTMSGKGCSAARDKLLISATGEIFPCEAFKSLKGSRPNIYTARIADVWAGDKLLNDIRKLDETGIINCSSCLYFQACGGGCPGERMLLNGSVGQGPDPWCILSTDNVGGKDDSDYCRRP